jgi:hypothetical protein
MQIPILFSKRKNNKISRASGFAVVLVKVLKAVIAVVLLVITYQYFQVKIYHFPAPEPFKGDSLYNPYKKIDKGTCIKANFHAHSKAWNGLTNGKQDAAAVIKKYHDFGYGVACISNYESVNQQIYSHNNIAIPTYEHGINISKTHQLVIGSNTVTFFDLMFWQTTHTRQYLLEKLKEKGGIICINHPALNNGHPVPDFSMLSGYECLEVLNRGRVANRQWDAALSAGKAVWLLANDDCHNIEGNGFARAWTLIQTNNTSAFSILDAVKSGNSIGVYRNKMFGNGDSLQNWLMLNNGALISNIETNGMTARFCFNKAVNKIRLIGQHGITKAEALHTDHIAYHFKNNDSYIRAEIETPEFNVYLNPIVRYNGKNIHANEMKAKAMFFPTLIMRLLMLTSFMFILYGLYPKTFLLLLFGKMQNQSYASTVPFRFKPSLA